MIKKDLKHLRNRIVETKLMHPFFDEIKNYPELANQIRYDLTELPHSYEGKNKIKAILLGADPTNDGIKTDKGLKPLKTVFGIDSDYEKFFFAPQIINLNALEIDKDNFFIQNVCRNYFKDQTGNNKKWGAVAELWLKYLKEEIDMYPNIPVLITAEKIIKVLTKTTIKAKLLYDNPEKYLPLYSESLQREVYPFYRHPKYYLSNNSTYRNYLRKKLN